MPTTTSRSRSPSTSSWRGSGRWYVAARTRARPVLTVGDLYLDPSTLEVRRGDVPVELSAKELAVLEVFMRRPGQVLSRGQIVELAWDMAYDHGSNVVDVYVRYLREKLDRPFGRRSLETVRGLGYRLRADQP